MVYYRGQYICDPRATVSHWRQCPTGDSVPLATVSHGRQCPTGDSVPLATVSHWRQCPTGDSVPPATVSHWRQCPTGDSVPALVKWCLWCVWHDSPGVRCRWPSCRRGSRASYACWSTRSVRSTRPSGRSAWRPSTWPSSTATSNHRRSWRRRAATPTTSWRCSRSQTSTRCSCLPSARDSRYVEGRASLWTVGVGVWSRMLRVCVLGEIGHLWAWCAILSISLLLY